MPNLPQNNTFTIEKAAEKLGVSTKTLRRWEASGYIKPQRTVGNQRRYTLQDIENLKHSKSQKFQNNVIPAQAGIHTNNYIDSGSLAGMTENPASTFPLPTSNYQPVEYTGPKLASQNEKLNTKYSILNTLATKGSTFRASFSPSRLGVLFSCFLVLLLLNSHLSLADITDFRNFNIDSLFQGNDNVRGNDIKLASTETKDLVLAAQTNLQDFVFNVNVPTIFGDTVTGTTADFKTSVTTGKLIAPNVIYSLVAGSGISVSTGQTPTITNTGVLSVGGSTGTVTFSAGTGISVSGTTFTNSDLGSAQSIFKNIAVTGQTTIAASSNTDILTFAGTDGITATTSATTKTITFSASGDLLNVSGWYHDPGVIRLLTQTDSVGIGTTNPAYKLDVSGTLGVGGTAYFAGFVGIGTTNPQYTLDVNGSFRVAGASVMNGINNNNGGITNAGPITGATGLTSSGTITFSGLSTGIVHSNFTGVLSSSAVDLANGDVTGTLPTTHGGTGLTAFNLGDMMYASASGLLANLGVGATGQVLTVSNGIPAWGTVSGLGGFCTDCVLTDPGSTQTIIPGGTAATGLIVTQANGGTVDIFSVANFGGGTKYLTVNNLGNTTLGGTLAISPANTDPITISPVAKGTTAYTGTITSLDLTDNHTWTFPDLTGLVCLETGNCAGVGSNLGGSGITNYITKWQGQYTLTNSVLYDNGSLGIGLTNPGSKLSVAGNLSIGSTYAEIAAPVNGAIIQGSVGIGTTNPTSTLYVQGTQTTSGTVSLLSTLGVTGATTLSSTLGVTSTTTIGGPLQVNGLDNSWIMGNLGVGNTNPVSQLSVGTAGQFQVNSTGNIVLLNNVITSFPSTQGSANSLLTNNGSGTLSWTNPLGVGASGVLGYWQRTTNSLAPTNIADDLNIGAIATASAYLNVAGTAASTGNQMTLNANSLSTGNGFYLSSTSTVFSTGNLASLYWNPGSATTATGDLLSLNVGSLGILGNLLNIKDNGSSIFSVSQTSVTANIPASFNAAGDVSMANDLNFTNSESSFINSAAPLYLQAGEIFNSSDLTLRTFNAGNVIVDSQALVANYAATVSGQLVVGTQTPDSANIGALYVTNSAVFGKALAILNQTNSADIFTASASGVPVFTITSTGNVGIGATTPVSLFDVNQKFNILANGNVGIGTTSPVDKLQISGTGALLTRITTTTATASDRPMLQLERGNTTWDMGINSNAANTANFFIRYGTTPTLVIDTSGNVGIGTTSPGAKLEVDGTAWLRGSTSTNGLFVNSSASVGIGTTAPVSKLDILGQAGLSPFNVASSSGTSIINIAANSYIGIGTTAPSAALEINGQIKITGGVPGANKVLTSDANGLATWNTNSAGIGGSGTINYLSKFTAGTTLGNSVIYDDGASAGIGTTAPGYKFQVVIDGSNEGHVDSVGSWARSSDISFKTNITSLENSLAKIMTLNPVRYDSVSGSTNHIGLIAQEVQNIYPEFVSTNSNTGKLGLSYESFVPVIIKGMQEQEIQLSDLSVILSGTKDLPNATLDSSLATQNDLILRVSDLETNSASVSAELASLKEQIASISASLSQGSTLLISRGDLGLQGGTFTDLIAEDATISGSLMVLGKTTVSDLGITGTITAGLMTIDGLNGEINTLADSLKLQSLALGNIEMQGAQVIIDTKGNISTQGTITAKTIETESIKVLGAKSAGSAILPAGKTQLEILTDNATDSARILITPNTLTSKILTVIEKKIGSFVVGIKTADTIDIKFDWLIIN